MKPCRHKRHLKQRQAKIHLQKLSFKRLDLTYNSKRRRERGSHLFQPRVYVSERVRFSRATTYFRTRKRETEKTD